ncbi:unnamed protein product [Medioppia subpectinata]|uniref:Uncharacterized protein n=1 Tax=Medioppia subpectinata TaxID=1979941 RepID=A0A7R9LTJ0_9ACAR|nr:unnamed protein product [Medioppia subpectinata]CAG2121521.1 unnamed protein product [Medioppia subpectinata]
MVDPDLFGRNGTNYGQFKHWLVVNIAGADLQNGRQLTEFIPSVPSRGTGFHRYVFLVYKQPDVMPTDNRTEVGGQSYSLEGRLFWDIRAFAAKYHLGQPIGINYYLAQFDS